MSDFPIPLKALADCGAILGRRGSGKSSTSRVIIEHELDASHRCCVIDPKGDHYGIRLQKDGEKASRFEIPVFGGEHADIPIDDKMGARIGALVAHTATSCIVDLSGFSRAGMIRFMTAFAEALFMENRQPLTLVVDEADQLAPQRVAAETAKLLHFMEALIRQGRQRGIFMWMLTQRPAVLNKNLLSQAETLIAMKMTTVHDRKAIRDWMDAHDPEKAAEVAADLAKLNVGQAWAWVPSCDFLQKVQFPLFETYDSGRTPQHGEVVGNVRLAPLDLAEVAKILTPEEDEQTDELEEARLEIDRLRRREREMRVEAERLIKERDTAVETLIALQDRIGFAIGSPRIAAAPAGTGFDDVLMVMGSDGIVQPLRRDIRVPMQRVRAGTRMMREAAETQMIAAAPAAPATIAADLPDAAEALQLGAGYLEKKLTSTKLVDAFNTLVPAQRRIVQAIAWRQGLPVSREQIAHIADLSLTSSNMGIGLERLRETGLVAKSGEHWIFIGGPK